MITFSEEALAFVNEKRSPVCIGLPYTLRGCCFRLTECPEVFLGTPENSGAYTRQDVQGVTLYVPGVLPEHLSLNIRLRHFFGFRRLFLDGWKPT